MSSYAYCISLVWVLVLCMQLSSACAQQSLPEDEDYQAVYDTFYPVYTHHIFNLGLYTNGWGFFYEYGLHLKEDRKHLASLEFSVLKDPKEKQTTARIIIGQRTRITRYIYGKQNIVYPIKLMYGQQYRIGLPNKYKGVALDWFYKGGLIFAFIRPYYLTVLKGTELVNSNQFVQRFENIRYSVKDSLLFTDPSSIVQYAGFATGWNETFVRVGVSGMLGLRMNIGPAINTDHILGFEAGVGVDAYTQPIPLLIPLPVSKANNIFLQGRFAFIWGIPSRHPSKQRIAILAKSF